MTDKTYQATALILRKTKLKESDLIIDALSSDGTLLRCVAKGARKPSAFSSRLELYAKVEIFCAVGKSLDIIKEARLVQPNEALRTDVVKSAAAAVMCEMVDKCTQMGNGYAKLFALTDAALQALCTCADDDVLALTNAHVLKTFAFVGLRPSFLDCCVCGSPCDIASQEKVRFSYDEGGVVCDTCYLEASTEMLPSALILWAHYLLMTPFSGISSQDNPLEAQIALLTFDKRWAQTHLQISLKSVDYLLQANLFS